MSSLSRTLGSWVRIPLNTWKSVCVYSVFVSGSGQYWESTTGLKQAKGLISGPSARRTKHLLKLNRDQLRWVVRLLTGHCHLKGHLFQIGIDWWSHLRKVPRRRRISHTHPVWLWGCSPYKTPLPGPVLHGTKWLLWRPIHKVLHFIRGVGLIRG
jgi:hypothetical protein